MNIDIRRIKDIDIALIKKISKETAWKSISEDQSRALNKEKWSRHMDEVFERIFKREGNEIFVAENRNHVFLGYVFVGEGSSMMTGTKHGFIFDIFVKKNYRGRGIGMMLMKRAEHYCRARGYTRMALMVVTNNQPAINLYTQLDFKAEQMLMGKKLC